MHKAKRQLARAAERLQGMERRKIIIWCALVLGVALVIVTAALLAMVRSQPVGNVPAAIALSGQITCLPHKAKGGAHTLECAIGLRADDDRYYGLKDLPDSTFVTTGGRVKVQGVLSPANDTQYDIVGTITVQNISR